VTLPRLGHARNEQVARCLPVYVSNCSPKTMLWPHHLRVFLTARKCNLLAAAWRERNVKRQVWWLIGSSRRCREVELQSMEHNARSVVERNGFADVGEAQLQQQSCVSFAGSRHHRPRAHESRCLDPDLVQALRHATASTALQDHQTAEIRGGHRKVLAAATPQRNISAVVVERGVQRKPGSCYDLARVQSPNDPVPRRVVVTIEP
jgi:hypothetical protein